LSVDEGEPKLYIHTLACFRGCEAPTTTPVGHVCRLPREPHYLFAVTQFVVTSSCVNRSSLLLVWPALRPTFFSYWWRSCCWIPFQDDFPYHCRHTPGGCAHLGEVGAQIDGTGRLQELYLAHNRSHPTSTGSI